MKVKSALTFIALALFAGANGATAQGTAFTYQGSMNDGANLANGFYDLRFAIYDAPSAGAQQGALLTNTATTVSNGLFAVTLDFGNQFPDAPRWLEIAARTNGAGSFTTLSPRQKFTATPYAITAGNFTGAVGNGQLANSSITLNAGAGLDGGGVVALGGSTTLNNAGVLSVTGNSDITVTTVSGAVTLGDTATNAATPGAIVKRDGGGNFSAASITLSNNLNLPVTTSTAGVIFSGNTTLLHTFGYGSFFAGLGAGNLTTSGAFNTGIGFEVLSANTSGFVDTAEGADALLNNTSGVANTAIGSATLENNTNGGYNTAVGDSALFYNTSGSYNIAIGESALFRNTSGDESIAIGTSALAANTAGYANVAIGFAAQADNISGNNNTALGYEALTSSTNGSDNTAIGAGAIGNNTNGSGNTAIGENALVSLTTGNDNTASGFLALPSVTTGSGNIAIGINAGSAISTGGNNIDIGNSGFGNESSTIRIGTSQTKAVMLGIFGTTIASGGTPVYVNPSGLLGTATSSARFKQNIHSMAGASDVLLALHPVAFQYKPEIDPNGTPQFGLVAEEVEKVDPALVVRDDKHQIYSVRYEAVNAMLLNEFLKEHRKVAEQNTEIEDLQQSVAELKKMVQSLAETK